MSVTLEVPEDLFHKIEALQSEPEETPIDIISKLVRFYSEDDEIDEETDARVRKGLEDVELGNHRPLRTITENLGI